MDTTDNNQSSVKNRKYESDSKRIVKIDWYGFAGSVALLGWFVHVRPIPSPTSTLNTGPANEAAIAMVQRPFLATVVIAIRS